MIWHLILIALIFPLIVSSWCFSPCLLRSHTHVFSWPVTIRSKTSQGIARGGVLLGRRDTIDVGAESGSTQPHALKPHSFCWASSLSCCVIPSIPVEALACSCLPLYPLLIWHVKVAPLSPPPRQDTERETFFFFLPSTFRFINPFILPTKQKLSAESVLYFALPLPAAMTFANIQRHVTLGVDHRLRLAATGEMCSFW